jgi:hypothetical protein
LGCGNRCAIAWPWRRRLVGAARCSCLPAASSNMLYCPTAHSELPARISRLKNGWPGSSTNCQVSPPSLLTSRSLSAVIQPVPEPSNRIDVSEKLVGLEAGTHVAPPSFERRICPAKPTAQPLFGSRNWMALTVQAILGVSPAFQVWPPSVVYMMLPIQPPAQPFWASRKNRHSSGCVAALFC